MFVKRFTKAILICYTAIPFLISCSEISKSPVKFDAMIGIDLGDHSGIRLLREKIKPLIDVIIQDELCQVGVDIQKELQKKEYADLFLVGQRYWFTLYYLDGYKIGQEKFMFDALDVMQKKGRGIHVPCNINITSQAAFFGDNQDELVVMIDDPDKSLHTFNTDIKNALHQADATYKQAKHESLFDMQRSERFPYVPHIALGRLRSASLKRLINGTPEHQNEIFNKIKSRIEKEIFPLINSWLTQENKKLETTSFCILVTATKKCLKQYALS